MTHKEKRKFIKDYDCEYVQAYLQHKGFNVDSLGIEIRYDGYIKCWKNDFSGDIVSYVFDELKLFDDLYDAIDDIHSYFLDAILYIGNNSSPHEEQEKKIQKANYIISVAQQNLRDLWSTDKGKQKVLNKLYELVPKELWNQDKHLTQEVILRYIGVDVKGDIGICLPNTIAIKRPKNSEMKWQCFGSREHIPFKLKQFDKPIYVAFGMKEILLFELLQLNYLVFQSDSSVKKLDKNIIDILNSYKIIIIPDNDLSCYKASMNFINKISPKNLRIITSFKNEKEDIVDYIFEYGLDKTKYLLEI